MTETQPTKADEARRSSSGLQPVIPPLVRRHGEDAAFYWSQLDASLSEPGLRAKRSLHFARLLDAHLEGLEVAAEAGLPTTQEALQRWRKPGEAFAASHSALCVVSCKEDVLASLEALLGPVLAVVSRAPDLMLRGLISALARAPARAAEAFFAAAWQNALTEPVCAVAALRASALRGLTVPADVLNLALAHARAPVRAAACRGAGPAEAAALCELLDDADLAVRAEAAIALGAAQPLRAAGILWQCVAAQAALAQFASGWSRLQARRRLNRWLGQLALLAPCGHPDLPALLDHLPRREALHFVLVHGDPAHLPFVLRAMQDPEQARWAGFVWQSLSGVGLEANGLVEPEPNIDVDAPLKRGRQDADQGLPLPASAAVAAHPANVSLTAHAGTPVVQGRERSPERLRNLLLIETDAPQLLRAVAARVWDQQGLNPRISLRGNAASLLLQDAALASRTGTTSE